MTAIVVTAATVRFNDEVVIRMVDGVVSGTVVRIFNTGREVQMKVLRDGVAFPVTVTPDHAVSVI